MRLLLLSSLLCLSGCSLFGSPTLDFDQMRGTLTEAEAMALQPSLNWQCSANDPASAAQFGDRVCDGLAKTLNGIPAARVDYLFRDGTLSFAIIEFNPNAYEPLAKFMDSKYKRHTSDDKLGSAHAMFQGNLTTWDVADGIAVTSATDKKPDGNVFMLWSSNKERDRLAASH